MQDSEVLKLLVRADPGSKSFEENACVFLFESSCVQMFDAAWKETYERSLQTPSKDKLDVLFLCLSFVGNLALDQHIGEAMVYTQAH